MSIETIQQFAQACALLSHEDIYELFEDEITQGLRDSIYLLYSDADVSEPMRQAMNRIGERFCIQSLISY